MWWTAPWSARRLSMASIGMASVLSVHAVPALAEPHSLAIFAALLAGGAFNVELGRRAEGGPSQTNRLSKGLSAWPFAAALLLPVGASALIAALLYARRARGMQVTLWKWINSWSVVSLAGAATSALLDGLNGGTLVRGSGSPQIVFIVLGALLFLAIEAALLIVVTRMNAREDIAYHKALLRLEFFMIELGVLAAGGIAAVLCRDWPGLLILAVPG